jgi:hypothetical protein
LCSPVSCRIVAGIPGEVEHLIDQGLQHHVHVGATDHDDPHRRVASTGFATAAENVGPCVWFHEAAATVGQVVKAILLRSKLSLRDMALVAVTQALEAADIHGLLRCTLVKCGSRLVHDDYREYDQYQKGHFGKEFSSVGDVLSKMCSLSISVG